MNAKRIAWVLVVAGMAHNVLRGVASVLGAKWGLFNYLQMPGNSANAVPGSWIAICGVLLLACWSVWFVWRGMESGVSRRWESAIWAAVTAMVLAMPVVWIATIVERTYGWVLFVVLPVVVGIQATVLLARREPIRRSDALTVSVLAIALFGIALLMLAFEGVICLAMAMPIALPLAMIGGLIGYEIHRLQAAAHPVTMLLLFALPAFGPTLERALRLRPGTFTVTTEIELAAPPERIWQTILQESRLAPPKQLLFRAGVAYPIESHIEGSGLTATRYCDFSTGKLVEPVLIWDEGRQLRFTVASNPLPMQEWTPYAQIHPPHLDGFLVARQGEFLITALPGGRTRLAATTWYQHHLWPAHYWRGWSDYIIHQVHGIVLENIRERVQAP